MTADVPAGATEDDRNTAGLRLESVTRPSQAPRSHGVLGEYFAVMRRMTLDDARVLMQYGVPIRAIATTCPAPTSIAFNRLRDRYWPDDIGHPAWVMPVCVVDPRRPELIETLDPLAVVSTGPAIDLLAFNPDFRRRWALRGGFATVLGAIEPQYLDTDPVPVYRDVTDWLRAECRGIVLLTCDPAEAGPILRQCALIEAEDPAHASELRRLLAIPAPAWPTIIIRGARGIAP